MRDLLGMTADELRELPRDRTVFFYSVGPAEDHGPHLPLGLDLRIADESVTRIARALSQDSKEGEAWECVRMPSLPLGIDTKTTDVYFAVRAHVLRDWLLDSSASLVRLGFRYFACVSGELGPRQLTAIEEVGPMLRRRFPFRRGAKTPKFLSLSSSWVRSGERSRSLLFPNPVEHGGREDTSLALALQPALAREEAERLPGALVRRPVLFRFWDWLTHRVRGYWGNPSEGTKAWGEQLFSERGSSGAQDLLRMLRGGSDRMRSGYGAYPHTRSFFKAWLWAASTGILLFFWLYLSLRYLPN